MPSKFTKQSPKILPKFEVVVPKLTDTAKRGYHKIPPFLMTSTLNFDRVIRAFQENGLRYYEVCLPDGKQYQLPADWVDQRILRQTTSAFHFLNARSVGPRNTIRASSKAYGGPTPGGPLRRPQRGKENQSTKHADQVIPKPSRAATTGVASFELLFDQLYARSNAGVIPPVPQSAPPVTRVAAMKKRFSPSTLYELPRPRKRTKLNNILSESQSPTPSSSASPVSLPRPKFLTQEQEVVVDLILKRSGQCVSRHAHECVSDQDLARLRPGQWLNDEVINFYGSMIMARSDNNSTMPKVHYFSSFFWRKLVSKGYADARLNKWTKKFDLFSKDIVLIPINHKNVHWAVAVINFRLKRIEYYDSMLMTDNRDVFAVLRDYLESEHHDKQKLPFNFVGWEDYIAKDTPQQLNFNDCGVFTCCFIEVLSKHSGPFIFTQADMAFMRRRIILEIGEVKFLDDN